MMCLTAFCHSIFLRLSPGDSVAAMHDGSHSFIGETWVVSAKVTMMTSADLTGRSEIGGGQQSASFITIVLLVFINGEPLEMS